MAAKKDKVEVKDEPGAEGRFLRGIKNALEMPHKPHKRPGKKDAAKNPDKKK